MLPFPRAAGGTTRTAKLLILFGLGRLLWHLEMLLYPQRLVVIFIHLDELLFVGGHGRWLVVALQGRLRLSHWQVTLRILLHWWQLMLRC